MKRTTPAAAFALSFATLGCSEMPSMPAWMPGSGWTAVLNGTKTAEIDNVEFASGPIALQFGNQPKVPGGAIKFRKVQIKPL